MSARVVARVGRDCTQRMRIHYRASRPLELDDAALFSDAHVTITPFSTWVAGAKDHVRMRVGGALDAAFVLGEDELVITYGKIAGAVPSALVARVEARIAERFGVIEHVTIASCTSRQTRSSE